jgi:hypothetical protein
MHPDDNPYRFHPLAWWAMAIFWIAAPSQDLLGIRHNHETASYHSTYCGGASFLIGAKIPEAGANQ